MPVPIARRDEYSGKWLARAPKSLHRDLVETADLEGVSFNQYVVTVLSAHQQLAVTHVAPTDEMTEMLSALNVTVVSSGNISNTTEAGGAVRPKLKVVGGSK